jgi:hypothetical protein
VLFLQAGTIESETHRGDEGSHGKRLVEDFPWQELPSMRRAVTFSGDWEVQNV